MKRLVLANYNNITHFIAPWLCRPTTPAFVKLSMAMIIAFITALAYPTFIHANTKADNMASQEMHCERYDIQSGQQLSWVMLSTESTSNIKLPNDRHKNLITTCFYLKNTSQKTLLLSAHLGNPRMNYAELTSESDGIVVSSQLGTDIPLALWGTIGTSATFTIELKPGSESRHTLRIANKSPYNSTIKIMERQQLIQTLGIKNTIAGLLSGIIGIMTIYFLFLSISTRDKTFFYLAGSTAAVTLMQLSDLGLLYSIWPRATHWNQTCSIFFAVLSTLFGNCLARNCLDTRNSLPRTDTVMIWFGWYMLLIPLPLSLINRQDLLTWLFVPAAFAFMLLLLAISITRIRQGYMPAKFYLFAYLLPFFSGFYIAFTTLGLTSSSSFSHFLPISGTAAQLILFSLALGERINWLNAEKSHAYLTELKSSTERRAKRHFLAQISHELRTPLIGIIGLTELIERHPYSDSEKKLIDGMEKSANNLLKLTNTLLDLARLDANKWTIEPSDFSLPNLINELLEKNAPAANEKKLQISAHIHENVPALVRGDYAICRRILQELIDNAIKFTQKGSIAIIVEKTLAPEHKDPRLSFIRFEIIDTGHGFDSQFQSRIFQLFELADSSSTRQQQGSGIGLSLCTKFSTLLGGTIGCNSHEGQGTIFWLNLPFDLPLAASESQLVSTVTTCNFMQSGHDILIAEDDAAIQMIVCALLDKIGANNHYAFDNGQQLFERYQRTHAQTALILLDWNMPVLNGYQTIQAIRTFESENNLPPVPVAFMSAHDAQSSLADVMGADTAILYKPVSAEALKKLLGIV